MNHRCYLAFFVADS
nr:hypothetical protein [Vibrio cholerae]